MAREIGFLSDGFFGQSAGINSGTDPSQLPDNQASFAVNATARGGLGWRTRPKFLNITLDFQEDEEAETWFRSHPISGQSYYDPPTNQSMLVCCAGGRFFNFLVKGKTAKVSEITPSDSRNNQHKPHTWFCRAAQYLVAQNGIDNAVIYDGASSRRADAANQEVPTGKQMAYLNSRLFVVLPDGRQIAAGDLAYVTANSVLEFNERLGAPEEGGGNLAVPLENGQITALLATAQLDTTAGQGILLAASEKAVSSFNPVIQRAQWPLIQLQNVALVGNGFTSQNLAIVNGDVWGRALDGWRSFVMARRDFSSWGNTPNSHEIERVVDRESRNLLGFSSFVLFDNRILGTCTPQTFQSGVYHLGFCALNFENVSSITSKSPPAYDGLWTGIRPYGFTVGDIEGKERCFAFCFHEDGNQLWEVTTDSGDDDDNARIQSFVETKSYDYGKPIIWKSLQESELYVDQMIGLADFNIKWRPDQYPCWFDYKEIQECAKDQDCSEVNEFGCQDVKNYQPQYRPRLVLGQPPDTCTPVLNEPARFGYQHQFKIMWTGNCRVRGFVAYVSQKEGNPVVNC